MRSFALSRTGRMRVWVLATAWLVAGSAVNVAQAQGACDVAGPIEATQTLEVKGEDPPTPFTLTPDAATEVINFGPRRGTKEVDIVLNSRSALPDTITAAYFTIDFPRRLRRVGENLESVTAPAPKFTRPTLKGHRRLSFTVCIDGTALPAGRYSGVVVVDGPAGMEPAFVAIAANAKNGTLWWIAFIGALVVALVVLLYRGASERLEAREWRKAFVDTLGDPTWWASSVVSLGTAFGTVYALYSGNPAWGEDGPSAVVALISATLTAAGLQSFLSTFRKAGPA